jgi:exopolyphosphatase/guanosine-5'-triphosphate,3'-diphosphate pyrophosphatase
MNHAVIDIGSNSMHLAVYKTDGNQFKLLFKEKIMAGLAGYVENGYLSCDGIECAYNCLLEFKSKLENLEINSTSVFATASLRNIKNTDEAVEKINAAAGYSVEIVSGEDEALFGYEGAMRDLDMVEGAFVDIGGASTEIVVFSNRMPIISQSYHVGVLTLYHECVKKILPNKDAIERIQEEIKAKIDEEVFKSSGKQSQLVCVGGTSRAVLKIAKTALRLPGDCRRITAEQLDELCELFLSPNKEALDIILKVVPERIHVIIPGLLILSHIAQRFEVSELVFSKYGVREGYLCRKIIN